MPQSGIVYHLGPTEDDSYKIFAVVPSFLHEIRPTAITPTGDITFPIDIYNDDLSINRSHWFLFEGQDWIFNWTGTRPLDDTSVERKLHRQFEVLSQEGQDYSGSTYDFPLLNYTKVEITKRGRYFRKGAIVIGHTSTKLRLLTSDSSQILVAQTDTVILDPDHTLPFGFPIEN